MTYFWPYIEGWFVHNLGRKFEGNGSEYPKTFKKKLVLENQTATAAICGFLICENRLPLLYSKYPLHTRAVNVSFFLNNHFVFFCPLGKKFISFRFRFWIQRKAKICLFFINKKFVFISKSFIKFYSLNRTKYSLIFH